MKAIFTGLIGLANSFCFFSVYKHPGWEALLPALVTMALTCILSIIAFVGLVLSIGKGKYKMAAGWALSALLITPPFVWMAFSAQISKYWTPW